MEIEQKSYQKVVDRIKDLVTEKKLGLGDKLPTERELATSLNIGRNSTREALRTLENMGVVESRQGSGTYLSGRFSAALADSFSMALLVGAIDFLEIARLRRALETEAFALAVSTVSAENVRRLETLLVRHEEIVDRNESTPFDKAFHDAIIRASQNRLLIVLTEALSTVYAMQIKNELPKYSERDLANLRKAHRQIFSALRDGDYQKGADAIDSHYQIVESRLVKERVSF